MPLRDARRETDYEMDGWSNIAISIGAYLVAFVRVDGSESTFGTAYGL